MFGKHPPEGVGCLQNWLWFHHRAKGGNPQTKRKIAKVKSSKDEGSIEVSSLLI
jgi:hypothetical protein